MTRNLYEALKETATARPNDPLFLDMELKALSYGEVLRRVNCLAAALAKRGMKKGDSFAIALRNSPEFIITYLALSRLGAVAVPINFLVTKAEELEHMLKDSGAAGVVTQREFLKNYEAVRSRLPSLRIWLGTDIRPGEGELFSELISDGAAAGIQDSSVPEPDDLACVLYTSGTTGLPKGAMLSHGNMLSNADTVIALLRMRQEERFIAILPTFHTFAWLANVVIPIRMGSKTLLVPSPTPPTPWLKLMGRVGITVFGAVPQIYALLAREAKGLKGLFLRYWSFRRVRLAISGAAPLPAEILSEFEKGFGIPILEGYGLTETSPVISVNTPEEHKPGHVGRPIEGVEVKILDESEQELAPGQEGEICVRGPNVMKGYWHNPTETKAAFTRDGRYFKTGDIGALEPDGMLRISDRKKDMIIIKGLKVFSAQIENVILSHPAVAEAAVVGLPDSRGEGEMIKAFVTLKPGAAADKAELLKFIRNKLDPYKRPRDIEILEKLPKNALQKVLKRELKRVELEKRAANPA